MKTIMYNEVKGIVEDTDDIQLLKSMLLELFSNMQYQIEALDMPSIIPHIKI